MKEKRDLNIMFAKSGSGGKTTRLTLPMKWIKSMDITEDERSVEVIYDDEDKSIIIKKK
ncbi:MAG: AbrB/MazE/SpoVT family DNA-binding domain-containing protein [Paraclostridium sp.]|uniref:AbrB/MazE/SpoVT family DNA-binding domain-containing protein n=1 Tax=Paeniclostridium hominis TaxID=2764329 RepID=A0ABR7K2Q8_9FIRM|nr:AbrB/MazE/SpoVT family DNA-binding domain-containing protein [Paeniclostridium hominis]